MRILIVFLCLAAAQANASSLYKCEGPKKDEISIQSEPCAAGSKQIWMRDGNSGQAQPTQQLPAGHAVQDKSSEGIAPQTQIKNPGIAANDFATKAGQARQRCKTAKEQAKVIRDRDRKTLTPKLVSQLDAWVESECKAK